jgi:hypothetical protein
VSSAEEPGINRPRTRPDHCGSAAERRQDDRHPRITDVCDRNPELDDDDQCSNNWGPEADKEKYGGAATNDVWNHRRGQGPTCEPDDTRADQQDCRQEALEQKTHTWPASSERRKESLQNSSDEIIG